jgi:hypothetical protein
MFHFGALAVFLESCLAAQLQTTELVNLDQFNEDFIAFLEFILDILDVIIGNLGDVQQTVHIGEDSDERPIGLNPFYFTKIDLADNGFFNQI